MSATHGHKADGTPITDAMVDEAERGYDVNEILRRRRGGRPPMGSAAFTVESVRLGPELKRDSSCAPPKSTSPFQKPSAAPSANTCELASSV